MVVSGGSEKRSNWENINTNAESDFTPNKAHQSRISVIPETPSSLLPTPPKDKPNQERRQETRRRKARIWSSSEDEVEGALTPSKPPAAPPEKRNLFSGLPVLKRRKKGEVSASERDSLGRKGITVSEKSRKLFCGEDGAVDKEDKEYSHPCGSEYRRKSSITTTATSAADSGSKYILAAWFLGYIVRSLGFKVY